MHLLRAPRAEFRTLYFSVRQDKEDPERTTDKKILRSDLLIGFLGGARCRWLRSTCFFSGALL